MEHIKKKAKEKVKEADKNAKLNLTLSPKWIIGIIHFFLLRAELIVPDRIIPLPGNLKNCTSAPNSVKSVR